MYLVSERIVRMNGYSGFLASLARSFGVPFLAFGAVIFLFFLVLFLLSRNSIRYLKHIVSVVHTMEKGLLTERVDVRSNDELGELAVSVNQMAQKLHMSMQEERRAEESKKELISSVSHDLRTPLTSVIGFLGLLKNRGNHSDADLERFSTIAHKKALRLKDLIDDLFEFTRVSYSGSFKLKLSRLDLKDLLLQLLEEYYPVFEENEMAAKLHSDTNNYMVQADGDLLARLFENLLINAVRYGKEGKRIDIVLSLHQKQIVIDVINYGPPIAADKLPHIFERFYKADESRSSDSNGSGLGLAIAQSIAELHRGTISAQSNQDRTVFKVTLPLDEVEHAS